MQKAGQGGLVETALHHDRAVGREHRHAEAIELLEQGIGIDVEDFHGRRPGMGRHHILRRLAQMAAPTRIEQQHHIFVRIPDGAWMGQP